MSLSLGNSAPPGVTERMYGRDTWGYERGGYYDQEMPGRGQGSPCCCLVGLGRVSARKRGCLDAAPGGPTRTRRRRGPRLPCRHHFRSGIALRGGWSLGPHSFCGRRLQFGWAAADHVPNQKEICLGWTAVGGHSTKKNGSKKIRRAGKLMTLSQDLVGLGHSHTKS